MSGFNGSGTFQISGVGLPYVSGTTISSATANTLNNDLATGLSNCITKDGQQVITANIGWNNHNINNLSSLGIGTATPSGQMHVVNGATTNFIIDSSGNVGIGTSSPAYKLDIQTTSASGFRVTSATSDTYIVPDLYGSGVSSILTGAGSTKQMAFGTAGSERMRIDSSGNVGIGTSSPAQKLDIGGSTGLAIQASLTSGADANFHLYAVNGSSTNASGQEVARFGVGYNGNVSSAFGSGFSFIRGGTSADGSLAILTAATERMRIDSSGNVGIGTSSPAFGLDVALSGAAGGTIRASYALLSGTTNAAFGTATGFRVGAGNSASDRAELGSPATTAGYIGYSMYSVGASAFRFYVNWAGTISATSSTITAISDQRQKENIRDLDVGLAEVMALKPRTFDWKQGKGKNINNDRGFIAQEFEQVFPDLIENTIDEPPEGEEPYKAINANLLPVLVKAIQELKTELDTVKSELAALKGS